MNRTSFSPLLTVLRVTKYIQMPVTWAPFINTILKFFSLFFRLSPPIIHKRIQWKGIKGEFISSAPPSHKIILHIHGGGFLLGLNWIYRRFAKILSINTSLPVLLLDYHLLPKHPFPVALKETVNAYLALLKYGYLPQDIVLIGDSVGGNLLAAALLFLKARNYPLPAKAALLSPWLDLTLSWSASSDRAPLDPILSPALMPKLIRIYLKNRKISARHPLVSPLY